jgi:2-oxoglutarate ferredoxin oxidoreductase subunit gamma
MAASHIKIGGFGGQGVILSAMVIGRAASIYDGKYATLTQSFGPEARGSACSAQLILSDRKILYPYVDTPEILMVMSQEAYERFLPQMKGQGVLIVEEDLVQLGPVPGAVSVYRIPATRLAEELGRKQVLNIVMVGFFTAVTDLVSEKSMRQAVIDSVPKGTETMNENAYLRGLEYGRAAVRPAGGSRRPSSCS